MDQNLILYLIAIPIIGGVFCLVLPDRLKLLIKATAILITAASFICSIRVFFVKPVYWMNVNTPVFLVDDLSAFIGMGIAFFALLVAVYSIGFISRNFGRYFGYFLMTLGAGLSAAYANDLIVLLTCWGFLALTLYLMINLSQTNKASEASKKALIIIGGTDALMLFGIALIWSMTGTFAMNKVHLGLNGVIPMAAYLCIAVAAFAKAGAMPFHSWLPDAAEDAPTPVTAYLPASVDKLLGIYLLARASLNLFMMNNTTNTLLLVVGSFTVIFAVIFALVQHDLKKLLGYHAVSQVGYMVLGIGTANPVGIAGGIFHMLNHAIYKSCLFLSAGAVEKNTHTTDLSKLGGLAKYMPISFVCFLVAALSISGIPPFNGFVSKWMVFQGIIESGAKGGDPLWILWLVAAMFGSALTIASFMKLLHAVFLGRESRGFENLKEVGASMTVPLMILAGLCIIFGIFAFPLPLALFIFPAIGRTASYIGIWSPTTATLLIILGIILGVLIYTILSPKKFRQVGSFVGGEVADDLERVSGTEFYDTVKDLKRMGVLYKKEAAGRLDIYTWGKDSIAVFTRFFQFLHNGILPTYLVWCLLGMVVMFVVLFFR